jgi:AraC family transcriptional regulator
VLEVALGVGFGSAEAFTRAFKLRYGLAPSTWRQGRSRLTGETGKESKISQINSNLNQINSNLNQATSAIFHQTASTDKLIASQLMQVKLEQMPPVTIAYLRHIGPYGAPIAKFWRETVAPWMVANDLCQVTRFGLGHDDPSFTDANLCRYDAAVACSDDRILIGDAFRTSLPGGIYAVLPFSGNNAQVVQAWTAMYREWLPQSGMQMDARPCFERYTVDAKFDPVTGIFDCDICIPVSPL